MYGRGLGVEQDFKEAFKWYQKAADQGDAIAQHNLGQMYHQGQGVEQDFKEAVKWYQKAADQGYAKAQSNLGVMYRDGEGVEQDFKEAVKWYQKAADQGLANGQYNLGWMYANGEGVNQDFKEAIKWYQKAADQGHAKAQHNLGQMYHHGQGVEQDFKEAVKWYQKAADQGFANAQHNLGVMYGRGLGVEQDFKEAFKWYQKAADQGFANSDLQLAVNYYIGKGVLRDRATSLKHLLLGLEGVKGTEIAQIMMQDATFIPKEIEEGFRSYRQASSKARNAAFEYWVQAFFYSNYVMTVPDNANGDAHVRACKGFVNAIDDLSLVGVDQEASQAVAEVVNYVEGLIVRKQKQPDAVAAIGLSLLSLWNDDLLGAAGNIARYTAAEKALVNEELVAYAALRGKLRKARIALSAKHKRNFPMFFINKKD
jgi:TPR repeat protein